MKFKCKLLLKCFSLFMVSYFQRITRTDSATEINFFLHYDSLLIFKEPNQSKLCVSHSLWNHSVLWASMSESHPHRLWIASLLSTVFKGTKYLGRIPRVTEYNTSKSDGGLYICWDVVLRNHGAVLGGRGLFFFFLYKLRQTLVSHLFFKSLLIILLLSSSEQMEFSWGNKLKFQITETLCLKGVLVKELLIDLALGTPKNIGRNRSCKSPIKSSPAAIWCQEQVNYCNCPKSSTYCTEPVRMSSYSSLSSHSA